MKSILIKDGLVDEVQEDVSARLRVIKGSKFRNLSWVVMPLDTGFLSCFMVNASQRKIMGQLLLFWIQTSLATVGLIGHFRYIKYLIVRQ